MKTTLSLIILVLILSCSVNAIVKPEIYKNVSIKFYNDDINKTLCYKQFDRIKDEYWVGMRAILINDWCINNTCSFMGYYYFGGVIKLNDGCEDIDILAHELGHNMQYVNGEGNEIASHSGNFWRYWDKIYGDT